MTAAKVEKLKPTDKRQELPDDLVKGLYLIVQPSGGKSWQVRYRAPGAHRRLTLGKYPILGLSDARLRARDVLLSVTDGQDPAAERRNRCKEAAVRAERDTIAALYSQFNKRHLSTLKSGTEAGRFLERFMLPAWGDRDIHSIRRRDVIELLDEIVDSGRAITANRVRAHVSKFFSWAVERDVIEASPVSGVKPPVKENVRDRVLTDDEIRWFWQACADAGHPWGPLGQTLLLTGQRLREVAGMREVEIRGDVWHLDVKRTKNRRVHDVPLSKAAQAVLGGVQRRCGGLAYIHTTTGTSPVSGFQKARLNIAERMLEIASIEQGEPVEIPKWGWHDLRRTAATGMARLGVPVRVTEAVLNHISGTGGGIVAVYQRHDYADEKRSALEAWAQFVIGLVDMDGISDATNVQ